MVVKSSQSVEGTSSSKVVRDSIALSSESAPESDDGSLGKLNDRLIKSMANDIAFKQVESQRDNIEASHLEAKKRKILLEREVSQLERPISSPVSGLGGGLGGGVGPGPIGLNQINGGNAEIIKAVLSSLESDEARLEYIEKHKHLLYGGSPGIESFSSFAPKDVGKSNSDIGSILTGMANMQLAQGQEQRNSLITMFELQNKLHPSPQSTAPASGVQSEDTKLMVNAMLKLAEAFAGGQNQMQKEIAQMKEERVKSEQAIWEKYHEAQRQADEERRKNADERSFSVITALQEKIEKLENLRANDGGVRGELAQLRNLIEKGKEFGLNLTNKTPEEEKEQRAYDLEIARLAMQKEMMLNQQAAERDRNTMFNNKIATFGTLLALGHDAMTAKKKLQKADPQTVNGLSVGL